MRRLLIVGCGDVGLRMLPALKGRYRVYALTHSESRHDLLRAHGVVPVPGDLDQPESLTRLAGIAQDVVHLAPPPSRGIVDTRTANLIRALGRRGSLPQRFVYMSTSGVYGDCAGEWVNETRRLRPASDRARRRVSAEAQLRQWGKDQSIAVVILRVPGIYASNRLPLERLASGTPALTPEADAYTNHIHADDLARVVIASLLRGRPGRAYNINDDSAMKMGDYFDLVAERHGLPRPPRVNWAEAQSRIPETLLSFMRESRRLDNRRLKRELRVQLRFPKVADALPRKSV